MSSSLSISTNTLAIGGYDDDQQGIILTPIFKESPAQSSLERDVAVNDDSSAPTESPITDIVMDQEEILGVKQMMNALSEDEINMLADEHMTLRHLRAEKGNVSLAISKIKSTIRWRKEFAVPEIIHCFEKDKSGEMATILQKENETGKIYVRGYDKSGRALMYMRPGNENTMHEDNNMRHLVFQLEKAIACSRKNGQSKICLVIDYIGFQLKNAPPMSTSKRTLEILQNHYPERMFRAYICNPPFVFRTFWALIQPFIDPVTKSKICFCNGKKGMEKIVEDMGGDVGARQLEPCAGGQVPVRPFDTREYMQDLRRNEAFDEDPK